jgi:hypothetical protein
MDNGQETTMESIRITVDVPPTFFADHEDRDCVRYSGERNEYVVKRLSKKLRVALHPVDLADLISDADYYMDLGAELDFDMQGLVSSARATKLQLAKLGFTYEWAKAQFKSDDFIDPTGVWA